MAKWADLPPRALSSHMGTEVVPSVLLLIQSFAMKHGSSPWALAPMWKTLKKLPASNRLSSGHRGISQWMEYLFPYFFLSATFPSKLNDLSKKIKIMISLYDYKTDL